MENSKKIFFVQKVNESEYETESIWCQMQGENYVIDNIPFIARNISLGDVIKAEYDSEDKQYYFEDIVSISGNTTIRIQFYDVSKIENVRNWLKNNECDTEVLISRNLVAVNVPKKTKYLSIKEYLDNGENMGFWTYQESALEHEY